MLIPLFREGIIYFIMNVQRIAGVSINMDNIKSIDFKTLLLMAKNSTEYYLKPDAEKLIIAEFKKHGILKPNTRKSKANTSVRGSKPDDSGKKGSDNQESSKSVEKGS